MNVASTENIIHQRTLNGTVVSDTMQKTRVVAVTRLKKHARYQKFFKVTTHYKAHDEENQYHIGDVVQITQTRPLSRDKRWIITALISKEIPSTIINDTQETQETTEV